MTTRQHKVHSQLGRAAVQIFAANDRMNQILIEHLDPTALLSHERMRTTFAELRKKFGPPPDRKARQELETEGVSGCASRHVHYPCRSGQRRPSRVSQNVMFSSVATIHHLRGSKS